MVTNTQTASSPPRLNPFAFPSDTDFRFILLIVSVLGASLFIYNAVYFSIPFTRDYWLNTQLQCWQLRPEITGPADFIDPEASAAQAAFERCRAPAERTNAIWIVGGVALLLMVAGLVYWTYPARIIRRDKLVPLSPDDAPEVVDYLAKLCNSMKLARMPVFLWNPLNSTSGGLAFGRFGEYYVSLTGGLITQFYTDLPAFRAIVLHELAHLRNKDVDKAYFAVAVWQAFLIAGLLPFVATIFENGWGYVFSVSWRVLALAVLVYLMRNAVLRTREMYADVRASTWDGSSAALGRVLSSLPKPGTGIWNRLSQVHPEPASRRWVLEHPGRLLPMGFWDAFATGIAAAVALPNIITVMTALLTGTGSSGLEALAAVLIVVPLVVGVVGLGAWRTTFAALERGKARRDIGSLGLGLGLGILLGILLSFTTVINMGTTDIFSAPELVFNIIWALLLLVSLFFFLRWIAAGASAWLEVVMASDSPRLFYTVGLIIAGGVLAIWLGFLFYLRAFGAAVVLLLVSPLGSLWSVVQHPLTFLGLISLWAFPLSARLSPRRIETVSESSWAFLGSSPGEPISMRKSPFRLRFAIIIALLAGLTYCIFLFLIRIGLRIILSETARSTEEFRLVFFLAQIGVAALFQAGTAAVAAASVQRLRVAHGLFSAFIAGCIMTVGILVLNVLFGGTLTPQFVWNTFSQVVNEGALLALPMLWMVTIVARFARLARGRPKLVSQKQMV